MNTVKLHTQAEALRFIDTTIRQNWESSIQSNPILAGTVLGHAKIIEATEVEGHKVWQYGIEGLPVSRDGRKRWLVDTGDIFDTTIADDLNTLEKGFARLKLDLL